MRVSRLVTTVSVLLGIVLAAGPGCGSKSNSSAFGKDAGGADGTAGGDGMTGPTDTGPGFGNDVTVFEGGVSTEAGFNDGKPTFDALACVPDAGGPGPVQHICVIFPASGDDGNECDGHHDLNGFPPNGTDGNGFDDNCNGLVDEGCTCTQPGTTKDCYLVPASQTVGGLPVGWCTENSKGTVDCVKSGPEATPTWSGQCRGAQPPFPDDFCAPGDFNCDGKPENSTTMNCSCTTATVLCPTAPLTTIPYPPVTTLPLKIDASTWLSNPASVSAAMNWKWTLKGGDCDNILPHPTFGIYATQDGSGTPLGTQVNNIGLNMLEHGMVASAPAVTSLVYPAFSLSGDYIMTGEFDLDSQHYSCTVKIQVRAPGLRAEACWSSEALGDDLDLHLVKVNAPPTCATEGWSDDTGGGSCSGEDCYYGTYYTPNYDPTIMATNWGYPDEGPSACVGWGAQAGQSVTTCPNPRLDRDANGVTGTCDPTLTNPNDSSNSFCGPENINLDAPLNGDTFAVAVRFYGSGSNGTDDPSATHVDLYCNGERILSTGYNPVTAQAFPKLLTSGADTDGDMWKVGLVTTQVQGGVVTCIVQPTPSVAPHPTTDGTSAYCVDNTTTDTANSAIQLTKAGVPPTTPGSLCFH
jgi:hypothetical protein